MSELRKHLQELKSQYDAMKYPGDLVADVRATQRPVWPRWVVLGTALAAMVTISVMLYPRFVRQTGSEIVKQSPAPVNEKPNDSTAKVTPQETNLNEPDPDLTGESEDVATIDYEFAPPEMPTGVDLTPTISTTEVAMSFSLPSFDLSGISTDAN